MNDARLRIILSSVFFVLGFSVVFSIAGVLLQSVLSSVAFDARNYLNWIAGLVIIFFGLFMLGVIKINFLQKEHKLKVKKTGHQYLTSFIFGGAFAIGWTPCVGAILGIVLSLAVTDPLIALPLMLAYSLGLGIPFIIAAVFISRTTGFIKKMSPYLKWFNVVAGAFFVLLGILVFTNNLSAIASLFSFENIVFGAASNDSVMFNGADFILKLAIAFGVGLGSFVSPCILPLVPAYLTYLAGTSLKEVNEEKKM